jgi:hypothetical protein
MCPEKSAWHLLLILFFGGVVSTAQPCVQDQSECAYYCQAGEGLGCDPSNYLFSFGHKYCALYLENEKIFSAQGQASLQKIRPCLIDFLKSHERDLTCANVGSMAVESHVACYVENGFCELPWSDKLRVVKIAGFETVDASSLDLFEELIKACKLH